ncbi:redoxin domain-containing protein [Rhodobacterales bacterium HKCCE3408]|nr:redoxin domain-containing protein [Rhodobacterales bacterium HKCCE3408]
MTRLMPDQPAPGLTVPLVGGGSFDLADETGADVTMIVVYRGLHCPICRTYLGRLNRLAPTFEAAGASLVVVSMDPQDRAEQAKAEWGLDRLRVGYGMTADTARSWGLWLTEAIRDTELPLFPEPGLFWVRPDGRLYLIDVATMPFARPDLDLLLERIPRVAAGYPARGTA